MSRPTALAILMTLLGCTTGDVVARPCDGPDSCPAGQVCMADGTCAPGDAGIDDGGAADAATADAGPDASLDGGDPTDFCVGGGPLLAVGDGMGAESEECVGRLAAGNFRYALCTCEGLATSNTLSTDSFDSTRGAYTPGGTGGSVGTNGDGNSVAPWSIGGSLWSSGGFTAGQELVVGSQLRLAGRLGGDTVEVAGHAFVGGGGTLNSLDVGGTLTTPAGADLLAASRTVAAEANAPVLVPDPCACGTEELVDVAGFVAHHATSNDNAEIALTDDALTNVTVETTLNLPCGRYYVSSIAAQAALTIVAEGRVALFVGADLVTNAAFAVQLAEGAELDLFVGGTVTASEEFALGSVASPALVRLYVGGDGTINLSGAGTFAGNLYGPRAELVTAAGIEVFGSVFVRRLAASGPVTIHYDTAILEAGDMCEPTDTCSACGDCPSTEACVDGMCGECRSDADCCSPLICDRGLCVPELI